MAQRLAWVLMSLILALAVPACAPKLVGPTAGSGYVFSLQVSQAIIWVGQVEPSREAQFPQVAEVIVRVQDAQGRAVDGVPVMFELEPAWARSITLEPTPTTTRGGIARAVISGPRTTGVVRLMARVDNTTAQARLTVQSYQGRTTNQ